MGFFSYHTINVASAKIPKVHWDSFSKFAKYVQMCLLHFELEKMMMVKSELTQVEGNVQSIFKWRCD